MKINKNNRRTRREQLEAERRVVEELGRFLSQFHWQAFVTPTFRHDVSFEQAHHKIEEWLGKLGPHIYAYVAYERGAAGQRTHCHLLIGGMYEGGVKRCGLHMAALAPQHAKRAWKHGDIKLVPFDPRRGAAWYVAKCPDDGEIIGAMKPHRPRRSRSRGRQHQQHITT